MTLHEYLVVIAEKMKEAHEKRNLSEYIRLATLASQTCSEKAEELKQITTS